MKATKTTFDLWVEWCLNLDRAKAALQANVSDLNFTEYVRAYRHALRRCEGLERAMTAN